MITKEQFISSVLYAFIGDAFGMPFDSVHPNFIADNYPDGFFMYEEPLPISKNNRLAAGSLTDVGGTSLMIMEMLNDSDKIDEYHFQKYLNRYLRYSSVKKHDMENNYNPSKEFANAPGFTNITRNLPYTLLNLNTPDLESNIHKLGTMTHTHKDSINYNLFHNMLLKDLTETLNLPLSIYNNLKYLSDDRDKDVMYRIIEEKQKYGIVDVKKFEDIAHYNDSDDVIYSNYSLALAAAINDNFSLIEKFLCAIYMGGATAFNCYIIGSIHGILHPDIEDVNELFLEKLHYGNEVRIIDLYDLAEHLYEIYIMK